MVGRAKDEARGDGRMRVLLIYRAMIPSIRLCGHCQLEWLAGEGELEYRAVQVFKVRAADLDWADVVVLGRLDSWYEHQLAKKAHASGRYLMYIIDDDLLNVPPEISSAPHYTSERVRRNIRGMMALSDAIISPSPVLLGKYAAGGKAAIQIEEPAIAPAPYAPHDPNGPVKIGFAGSIDRTGDAERILADALLSIKRAYGERVEFEFFGAIPSFAGALGARCIPYCDSYDEYKATLNRLAWDIGLAPMPDTPFHACKHYNKFVEYAAAGIVGVYSDVMPYARLRGRSYAPMLCANDPKAWADALSGLIESSEREQMRRRLCALCEGPFSVRETARSLLSQMETPDGRAKRRMTGELRLIVMKGINALWRAADVVRQYGWGIFPKALGKLRAALKRAGT